MTKRISREASEQQRNSNRVLAKQGTNNPNYG